MDIIGIDISVEPRGSPDKAKFDPYKRAIACARRESPNAPANSVMPSPSRCVNAVAHPEGKGGG